MRRLLNIYAIIGKGNLDVVVYQSVVEDRQGCVTRQIDQEVVTEVEPIGPEKCAISFTPMENVDHTIEITFNKDLVPGSPFVAKVENGIKRYNLYPNIKYEIENIDRILFFILILMTSVSLILHYFTQK